MMKTSAIQVVVASLVTATVGNIYSNECRSYCGNLTVDYPFGLRSGCGHPGFGEVLFCVNEVLMFHVRSGSYRVMEIDYPYGALTLQEPHMSTCQALVLGARGNGFSLDPWRAPFFSPAPDNLFMLLRCSPRSPLFQGFPSQHLPCTNISGMGCEDYYGCPAWGRKRTGSGMGPPDCCALSFQSIKSINLTQLECEGYSSAYSLAPLRLNGPQTWAYGIRLKYSAQGGDQFCRACEATGGTCGYGTGDMKHLCMCGTSNSTSTCDFFLSVKASGVSDMGHKTIGIVMTLALWMTRII